MTMIKGRLKRDSSYPRYIYVKRIGYRKLINGDRFTEKYGFTTIIPEELSVEEQMNYFHNANIVLCPHGANSTNCLYMHEGSAFVEIFSERWCLNVNADVCRRNHICHIRATGPAAGVSPDGMRDDYTIPEDTMLAALKTAYECIGDPKASTASLQHIETISGTRLSLEQASKVLIYGAWRIGTDAYDLLKELCAEKIMGFAVTSMAHNLREKESLPVKALSDWQAYLAEKGVAAKDTAVILALNPAYYREVSEALRDAGFEKIITEEELEWYSLYKKKPWTVKQ